MRGVRLHALAQLAYEGIMDDLAVGEGVATNTAPASASQGGCSDCSLPAGTTATRMRTEMRLLPKVIRLPDERDAPAA